MSSWKRRLARVYRETATRAKAERDELRPMSKTIQSGNTVAVSATDRLIRSTQLADDRPSVRVDVTVCPGMPLQGYDF